MGKLRVLSGRDACEILKNTASTRSTDAGTVTIPVPDHPDLAIGTLLSIIRQSGIARTEFES